jgi:hypothetical protein
MAVLTLAFGLADVMTVASRADAPPAAIDWQAERLGPKSAISVFWVGHSLMNAEADSSWGRLSLMSMVDRLAKSRNLGYAATDHTLYGSPLSALWRGAPHGYERDATEMVAKRQQFERDAGRYDTIVLTESVPLAGSLKVEFTPYYLRRFYCAAKTANPATRVYLYQTWVHLQGSIFEGDIPPGTFDWPSAMRSERALWERLSEDARRPEVEKPSWLRRLGWTSTTDGGCAIEDPIFIVPVGNAFLAIDERLSAPHPSDRFSWPDGTQFLITDLVVNPRLTSGALRDPSKEIDDIHPSLAGIYVGALVHFATLYRQTPVGLDFPPEIGAALAGTLQCIAWETVVDDPHAGVQGTASCAPPPAP